MITEKQKQFLIEYYKNPKKYKDRSTTYLKRIQQQIEQRLNRALWLAKHYPNVLLNENKLGDSPRHKRLQKLLLLIKILKPQYDVYLELVKDYKEMSKVTSS